jgi:hypothetical protein
VGNYPLDWSAPADIAVPDIERGIVAGQLESEMSSYFLAVVVEIVQHLMALRVMPNLSSRTLLLRLVCLTSPLIAPGAASYIPKCSNCSTHQSLSE